MQIMIPEVPRNRHFRKYLNRIDRNRQYSNFGPLNEELRIRISKYVNCDPKNIVTVNNATIGIQGAIETSNLLNNSVGDGWTVPSWTFAATVCSVENAGVEYSFSDTDQEWRIELKKDFKGVVDVLPFGDKININRFNNKVEQIVIDGAASFDSIRNCGEILNSKSALIVSLHATKLMPAGEGAFFYSPNTEWCELFRSWTTFGFVSDRNSQFVGTNGKLNEFSAAVALSSFDKWEITRKRYKEISRKALEISSQHNLNVSNAMRNGFATPYWIVECDSPEKKSQLSSLLRKENIPYRDWWEMGCHRMRAFSHVPRENLTRTEFLASVTLGMPFHLRLSKNYWRQIERIFSEI